MSQIDFQQMRRLSADIRIETVRAIGQAGFGHIGGAAPPGRGGGGPLGGGGGGGEADQGERQRERAGGL